MSFELNESGMEHFHDLQTAALKSLAEAIAEDAKGRAPVLTGTLRDSIAVVEAEDGKSFDVVAQAPYAAAVELGTTTHKAQPFLRPAGFQQREPS